ncbi:MAG: DUF1080 domain-containing protein [Bacteroidota bacterium]
MKYLVVTMLCGFLSLTMTAQEFIPIFNGKNLDGWKASTENPNSFLVEDGMLVCRGGRAHLFYQGEGSSEPDFKNFELKLRIKTTAESNSGVYFHTKYQASDWPSVGFEAQVNSKHSDPRKTGSLYGVVNIWAPVNPEVPFVSKVNDNREVFVMAPRAPSMDDEWFDYHLIVQDNRIQIKVNGMTTVDWTQPKDWTSTRRIGSGTVGLQAHDPKCDVYYKDIHLKVLD